MMTSSHGWLAFPSRMDSSDGSRWRSFAAGAAAGAAVGAVAILGLLAAPRAYAEESRTSGPDGGGVAGEVRGGEPMDAGTLETPQKTEEHTPPVAAPGPPASSFDEGENRDLGLIPPELEIDTQPAAPATEVQATAQARVQRKLYAEDALTLSTPSRPVPVPYPAATPTWQNRSSLDVHLQWQPWRPVTVHVSDRLNLIEVDDVSFFSRQTLRNDLREAYVGIEVLPRTYLEVGRINLRSGVALGWNPTDFFKSRTLVGQASLDPSAMRRNRLGALMARFQTIWDGGSLSFAYAPKIQEPSAIIDQKKLGIDPRFDATNSAHRAVASVSFELGALSPQVFGIYEASRSKIGVSLTRSFGDAVVAYAEWAGGEESDLVARGFAYGQATGTLPPTATSPLPTEGKSAFRNDVAAGASVTIASTITVNAEYHFHQSGFTRSAWRSWFDVGSSPNQPPIIGGALWYVRGYAADQQEPTSRHQVFVRAAWPRFISSRFELSGFALVNPDNLHKGSTLAQMSLDYYPTDAWTLTLYGSLNAGIARSERGSLPQLGSAILQIVRYF